MADLKQREVFAFKGVTGSSSVVLTFCPQSQSSLGFFPFINEIIIFKLPCALTQAIFIKCENTFSDLKYLSAVYFGRKNIVL